MENSRWVKEIISLQKPDSSWGYFHTLSNPTKSQPITTEQALRRLKILGLTENDEPIQRAIKYIESCLKREIDIPDRREKFRDWEIFRSLMFATWIKIFSPQNQYALDIAKKWTNIIENAFLYDSYNHIEYLKSFSETFGVKPHNDRSVDFVTFYQVSILQDMLNPSIEEKVINYIINDDTGIYYIYGAKIATLPKDFSSKETNRYLSAIELLSGYDNTKGPLGFVVEWLKSNKHSECYWDLGSSAKDGINFPLSDSWRSVQSRRKDCTLRIERLIEKLGY